MVYMTNQCYVSLVLYSLSARGPPALILQPMSRGRVIAWRVPSALKGFSFTRNRNSRADWLGGLIDCTKALSTFAGFAPFPYIKTTICAIVEVLQAIEVYYNYGLHVLCLLIMMGTTIQRVGKNNDDLKDLAQAVVDITVIIRDEVLAHGEGSGTRFKSMCEDFSRCAFTNASPTRHMLTWYCAGRYLCSMTIELNEIERGNHKRIKQYLESHSIRETINRYQKNVHEMRANFTVKPMFLIFKLGTL